LQNKIQALTQRVSALERKVAKQDEKLLKHDPVLEAAVKKLKATVKSQESDASGLVYHQSQLSVPAMRFFSLASRSQLPALCVAVAGISLTCRSHYASSHDHVVSRV